MTLAVATPGQSTAPASVALLAASGLAQLSHSRYRGAPNLRASAQQRSGALGRPRSGRLAAAGARMSALPIALLRADSASQNHCAPAGRVARTYSHETRGRGCA